MNAVQIVWLIYGLLAILAIVWPKAFAFLKTEEDPPLDGPVGKRAFLVFFVIVGIPIIAFIFGWSGFVLLHIGNFMLLHVEYLFPGITWLLPPV